MSILAVISVTVALFAIALTQTPNAETSGKLPAPQVPAAQQVSQPPRPVQINDPRLSNPFPSFDVNYTLSDFTAEGGAGILELSIAKGETKTVRVRIIPWKEFEKPALFVLDNVSRPALKVAPLEMPGIEVSFEPKRFMVYPNRTASFVIILHARNDAPDRAYNFGYAIRFDEDEGTRIDGFDIRVGSAPPLSIISQLPHQKSPPDGLSNSTNFQELRLTLSLEKLTYQVGENVIFGWNLTNTNAGEVILNVPPVLDYLIVNASDKPVWGTWLQRLIVLGCTGHTFEGGRSFPDPIAFRPGRALVDIQSWDMKTKGARCISSVQSDGIITRFESFTGPVIPPGNYELRLHYGSDRFHPGPNYIVLKFTISPEGNLLKEERCDYLHCGRYVIMKDEGNFQIGDWLELREGGIAYIDSHPKNVQGGRCTATLEKAPATKWNAIRVPLNPARPNENLEIRLTINACGLTFECLPQVGTRPAVVGPDGRIVSSPTGQDRLACNNFLDGNSGGTWIWCEKPEPLESMKKYCSSLSAGNVIRPILPKAAQG
ncbi:MAG: hypothetical protein HYU02_06690 [Thaumarchaeota archaeon]|nr:hypothetical protein [Nitrososphaerota archaeon]